MLQRLREAWRRFWALPWRRKGPALGIAVLVPAVIAAIVVPLTVLGSGDDAEAEPTPTSTRTATPSATATPTPSETPVVTPTSAPAPAPTEAVAPPSDGPQPPPAGRPAQGGYRLAGSLPGANFDRMLGFRMIPGSSDQAVVLTQAGAIWRISVSGAFAPAVWGDISGRVISPRANEEGLLGLAFSPNFGANGRVYLHYTAGNPRRGVISRFQATAASMNPGSERAILEVAQPAPNHNGGQLAFGPDGYLYVGLGDGGGAGDTFGNAQNLGTLLGSILRLNVSGDGYQVPGDNPFAGRPGARGEIYAYGLRNPWRFSFDRATGALWAGDVGQDRWEEVDRIVRGGNYGWPIFEGYECFRGPCDAGGLTAPRAAYPLEGNCAVMGGYVYRGPSMPELNGWFVYGDFCSGNIWAVNTADGSAPVLLAATGLPISSFGELPNGELVAVTFANAIYRLQRAQ